MRSPRNMCMLCFQFAIILSLLSGISAYFLQWGPDLEGPWCARRPRGRGCCAGRDDNCAVPILDTECYCDVFCNNTAYDCCPDYWSYCFGAVTTRPPTTTLLPPRTTRPFGKACLVHHLHRSHCNQHQRLHHLLNDTHPFKLLFFLFSPILF